MTEAHMEDEGARASMAQTKRRQSALIGCVIPPVSMIALGLAVAFLTSHTNPFELGQLFGRLAFQLALPSGLGALAIYKGWKKLGWSVIALSVALPAVFIIAAAVGSHDGQNDRARAEFAAGANEALIEAGHPALWSHEGDTLVARPGPNMRTCREIFASLDRAPMARFFRTFRCVDGATDDTIELPQ